MRRNENLLLDTHIWIWLLNGDSRILHSLQLPRIVNASNNRTLYISAISIWEVAMLESKKRLSFSTDISSWVKNAITAPGLNTVELIPEISIDSANLPGAFHGDPADRIIVATARYLRCPLLTADSKILEYSKDGYITTIKL